MIFKGMIDTSKLSADQLTVIVDALQAVLDGLSADLVEKEADEADEAEPTTPEPKTE